MKKIIAIICAVAMLLSFTTTAFADEWDILVPNYKSYEAVSEFSMVLNKPLECLALLNEEAGFDVKSMVEELTKAKYTAKIQAETSPDGLKAKAAMTINSNVPLNLSEDLKFGADVTFCMWVDYDFTSEENARYEIILKNPLNGKYLVLDYFKAFPESYGVDMKSTMMETFKDLDMENGIKELTELAKAIYKKNAKLEKAGNEYTVTFTNDGMIDMAFDAMEGYFKTEYAKSLGLDEAMPDMGDVDMATVKTLAKGMGIFGENDALVMKIKTDDKMNATEIESSIHLDFNIAEIVEATGEDASVIYPLTKENSNIDITFKSKNVYSRINEENVVQFPILTEENSMDMLEAFGVTQPEEDYVIPDFEMYQSEYFWDNAKGMMDRGGMYVSMDEFLDSCYWDDDNLTGEYVLGENGDVEMSLTSDNFGTVTVKGNIHSDEYMLNSTKLWARKPFKVVEEYSWDEYEAEDKLYVNMEVLNYILGAKVQMIQTYILDDEMKELQVPEYYFEVVRPNPGYVALEQ